MAFVDAMLYVMKMKGLERNDVICPGISAQYLSKLITRKVKDPTWDKAQLIIDQLGMTCDEFRNVEVHMPHVHTEK